jgi:O-antigen/teichoic acid export membrane protein
LIWLGPTWAEVVPLIRVLCIAYLFLFAACLTYPVLVAVGRVRDALVSSLISLPPSLLMIFIASFFSVQAVAASALLTLPLQAFVAFHYLGRHLAIRPADLLRATLKSAIVTFCSAACVLTCAAMIESGLVGPAAGLFLAGISAAAGWWFGLVLTEHLLLAHVRAAVGGIALAVQNVLLAGLHTRSARRK